MPALIIQTNPDGSAAVNVLADEQAAGLMGQDAQQFQSAEQAMEAVEQVLTEATGGPAHDEGAEGAEGGEGGAAAPTTDSKPPMGEGKPPAEDTEEADMEAGYANADGGKPFKGGR